MFGRDADDIAMVEDVNESFRGYRQKYEEDAQGLVGKLDEILKSFTVKIDVALMKDCLKRKENPEPGIYLRTGVYVGDDYVRVNFDNDIYGVDATLRSNPRVIGVQRQLFISNLTVRIREKLFLKGSGGVEATLTSDSQILTVPYQERTRPDSLKTERGFFIPDSELNENSYILRFSAGLRGIDIPYEPPFDR